MYRYHTEEQNSFNLALCHTNQSDITYIKRKQSSRYYISSYINSLVRELIIRQSIMRHMREIRSDHIAMILDYNIIGTNSLRSIWSGSRSGTHAEMAALNDLPNNFSKRTISIDILVIRSTCDGNLKNSKPCFKCIKYMKNIKSRRYCVRKVIYSDDDGNLKCENFADLCCSNKYVCKRDGPGRYIIN